MPGEVACPNCAGPMEEGFIFDHSYMYGMVAHWFAGKPVSSFWRGIVVSGKRSLPITVYRCVSCGKLDLFAN